MRARLFVLPIAALALAGCDRITGADQQKTLDAEAIGFACRISLKTPEDCMKENDTQSPTSLLTGWKEADKEIKEKTIDPNMGKAVPDIPQSAPVAAEAEGKTDAATGKPDQGAADQKTNH